MRLCALLISSEKPESNSLDPRNGKDRMSSLAEGRVLFSGITQRPFNPHIEESTTKRGGLESLVAIPNFPIETPIGYSCCACARVPGYLKINLWIILQLPTLLLMEGSVQRFANWKGALTVVSLVMFPLL